MNKPTRILLQASAGTTMMTLFSYLVSLAEKENFSEPEHLSTLLRRLCPGSAKKVMQIAGWGAHYAVGLFFVLAYRELWQKESLKRTWLTGSF